MQKFFTYLLCLRLSKCWNKFRKGKNSQSKPETLYERLLEPEKQSWKKWIKYQRTGNLETRRFYTRTNEKGQFYAKSWKMLGHPNDFVYDHDKICPLGERSNGNIAGSVRLQGLNKTVVFVFVLLGIKVI